VSTQEVVKEQGNLLEVSHFTGTQIHRALAHEKGTGLGAAVAMLEALIVIISGYAAYSGRDFLGNWSVFRRLILRPRRYVCLYSC